MLTRGCPLVSMKERGRGEAKKKGALLPFSIILSLVEIDYSLI